MAETYEPTAESLARHPVPDWYNDAKLGIFIHWGLYSVPAFAPKSGSIRDVIRERGLEYYFRHSPYAEWYWNTVSLKDNPSWRYHAETFGEDFPYQGFAPIFRAAAEHWDPDVWAELFQIAGARYVVLTTKHHDGFLLWPSRHPNPFIEDYQAKRDLVGELAAAVRARGMRFGVYYSGGIDWTFQGLGIGSGEDFLKIVPQTPDYARYADAHWRELIDRYEPSILWDDIGYPANAGAAQLFADYYNRTPDGVINDRFEGFVRPRTLHFDFSTPEYEVLEEIGQRKWEATRGIGNSFGYNREETAAELLSPEALVHMLVDIVAKNGNLLLNVGPAADGTVPWLQAERLLALGWWLCVNGDAVYGTRPWQTAAAETTDGLPVRFTRKGDALYAMLLGTPGGRTATIKGLVAAPGSRLELLGPGSSLAWEQRPEGLEVRLPLALPAAPAHVVRISPVPAFAG